MSKLNEKALARAYERALELEKAGRLDEAAAAYREVLRIDPADCGGASVRLAAMQRGAVPDKAPDAYVATLFDQHAEIFEDILVDQLGYHVPLLLRAMLEQEAMGRFARLLDLGCGTGLMGVALDGMVEHLTGVDLSETMVDVCGDKEIYDALYACEVVRFLSEIDDQPWDLVTATDVLPYIGDVRALFAGVARHTTAGALWGFSSETLMQPTETGYTVGLNQRFLHMHDYVERELDAAGFDLVRCDAINVRYEEGVPSPGELYLARRRGR